MSNYITPIYVDYAGKMRKTRTTGEVYSESNKVILKRGDTATLAVYFLSQATNLPFALATGATITCAIKEKNKFDATSYICYGSTINPPSESDTSYELTIPLYSTELNELLGVNGDTDVDPAYIDLGIEISWSENNGETWRSTTDPVTVRIYNDIIREDTDLPILEVVPVGGDMPSKVGEDEGIGVSTYAARADHKHALQTVGEAKIVGSSTVVPTVEVDDFGRVVGLATNAIQTLTTLGEPKTVGSSLVVPSITIDEYGRITALTSNAIQALTTIGEAKVVGSSNFIPVVGIDEYGRVTSLQSQAIGALTTNQIAGLATQAPVAVATTAILGLSAFAAKADHAHALSTVGEAKVVGSSTTVPVIEVDEFGRIISLDEEPINPVSGNAPVWKGEWTYNVTYYRNDVVSRYGSSYLCILESLAEIPDQHPAKFVLLAEKGADGTNGTNGTNGSDGLDGTLLNNWRGEFTVGPLISYNVGDIVSFGGNVFVLDEFPEGLSPFTQRPDAQYWKLLLSGLKYIEEWSNQSTYYAGCVVTYLGSSYLAITTTSGNNPTNPSYWQLLASKGDKGDTGETGAAGSDASVTLSDSVPESSNSSTGEAGTSNTVSRSNHKHPLPSYTGDVGFNELATFVQKIRGINVTEANPSSGQTLQFDGAEIVWADAPAGGSGGGGLTFYLNYNTIPDLPTTGLPTLDNSVEYKELGRSADSQATSLTSNTLPSNGTYVAVCGFVSDRQDPNSLVIPVGLWDFNVWCSAVSNDTHTSIRAKLYSFDGSSSTLIATSASSIVSSTIDMVTLTVTVPQTTLTVSDRMVVVIEAATSGNNHTITLNFGNSMPSHTHTTLPSVGGSGLVRVVNGVIQSQGSKVLNSDFEDDTLESAKLADLDPSPSGAYGSSTKIPIVTVNSKGLITGIEEITAAPISLSRTKIVGVDAATIQGCINLITDASATNQAQVLVPPGVYAENLTLKPCVSVIASGSNNGQTSTVRITGNATFTGGATAADNTLQLVGLSLNTTHATTPALTVAASGGVTVLLHVKDCMLTSSNAASTAVCAAVGTNCSLRLYNSRTQGNTTAGQGGTHIDVDGGTFYGENWVCEYGTRALLLRGTNGALKPYAELKWSNLLVSGANVIEITSATALLTMGWTSIGNLAATGNGVTVAAGSVVGASQCVFAVQAGASNYVVTGSAGSYYYSLGNSYSNATGAPYETKIGASVTQFQYARSYDPAGGDLTGSFPSPTLATVGTAKNAYGSSTFSPVVTIDAKGRVTALTSVQISALTTAQLQGLSTADAAPLGAVASSGVSPFAAHGDHVHPLPTPAQVGAIATTGTVKLSINTSGAGTAGINLTPLASAPALPTAGDIWVRANVLEFAGTGSTVSVPGSNQNNTFAGQNTFNNRVSVSPASGGTVSGLVVAGTSNAGIPMARITQTGAGDALVVEDATNPDLTAFSVNAVGRVGIGVGSVSTTETAALTVDSGGIKVANIGATAFCNITVGAGSPEGVITAGPGSLYLNTSGGAGTTLYVKESGVGNTGWVGK
jgi:hypothetical protein